MAHIVQCRICKGKIDTDSTDEWVMPSKNWYYHKSCYADFGKKKGPITEESLLLEIDDEMWFAVAWDYLRKDLKMDIHYQKIRAQWTSFIKKGMTAKGIYFTLRYFYEIKRGDVSKSENGIGIVPFIYEEGTCYWGERNLRDKDICRKIEAQVLADRQRTTKVIFQKEKKKSAPVIDLSSVLNSEDEDYFGEDKPPKGNKGGV